MFIITKKSLDNINKIELYDWQIKNIICNYDEYKILIPMTKIIPENRELKAELSFEKVLYTEISYYELWGSGNYISHCDINDDNHLLEKLEKYKNNEQYWCSRLTNYNNILDEFISFNITLNSGDIIRILTNQIIFNSKF